MKKILVIFAAVICLIASNAFAVPISGSINFSGSSSYLGGTTPSDATGIHFDEGFTLKGGTGDYAAVPKFTDVTFQDFYFNPTLSTPVDPLWSFNYGGKTYDFIMNNVSYYVSPDGSSLTLSGSGVLQISGLEDTFGTWNFTTQGSNAIGSFSATSAPVPEPGTLLLLGSGLVGMFSYGRRRMKR